MTTEATDMIQDAAAKIVHVRPKIGVYRNIPADQYHSWDCASSSRLSTIAVKSPAHVRYEIDHPEPPTPSLLLGDVTHVLALQPGVFESRFMVAPEQCTANLASGSRCKNAPIAHSDPDWFCGIHARNKKLTSIGGRRLISAKIHDAARSIVDALRAHSFIRDALDAKGECETSAVWDHDGLLCKMRADKLAGLVIDLKTTRNGYHEAFRKAAYDYGYHRQAAFYLHGLAAHKMCFEHYLIIAVEPDPPHSPLVYKLHDDDIELGWKELEPALKQYAWCEAHGVWPGYGFNYITEEYEVHDLSLPAWARSRGRDKGTEGVLI